MTWASPLTFTCATFVTKFQKLLACLIHDVQIVLGAESRAKMVTLVFVHPFGVSPSGDPKLEKDRRRRKKLSRKKPVKINIHDVSKVKPAILFFCNVTLRCWNSFP